MNKYHLMLAYTKMRDRPKAPHIETVLTPLIFAVGLLLALLPTDFKNYLGVDASTWQALVILMLLLSAVLFLVLFGRWVYCLWRYPALSEEEWYDGLCAQMEADRAKVSEIEARRGV